MITIATAPVKTYLSKSKIAGFDYVINPYIGCPHKCVYCYAEYMRKFTGHPEEWGEFLDVKTCEVPLPPAKLFHTRVMLSSVTDPYNPYEEQYGLTRKLLKQLEFCQAYVHILTKSPLVLRDLDILKKIPGAEVALSFSGVDEHFRELAEPGAGSVQEKINALKTLHENGIKTAVMAAPVFPGITDWKALIEATRPYTDRYGFDSLNIRPAYQKKVMSFVAAHYPDTLSLYADIYLKEDVSYWRKLEQEITQYCKENDIHADIYFSRSKPFA